MSSITELASSSAMLKSSSSRVFSAASAGQSVLESRASIESLKVAHVPVRYAISGRPGGLSPQAGVCTAVPAQHPHVQSCVSEQLTGSSLSPLHHERQLAVIGKAGVVLEARDLERPQRNLP